MAERQLRKYILGNAIWRRSLLEGFTTTPKGGLQSQGGASVKRAILPALDSAIKDCAWGRISFDCKLSEECVLSVRAFASNDNAIIQNEIITNTNTFLLDPQFPIAKKERLFTLAGGKEQSGVEDMLLYGQTGRYLWLWLEMTGEGSATLEDLKVYIPGDNFFPTLPQVYKENNEFLHRFLSIFSTMYNELQEEIEDLPTMLEVENAPLPLLHSFATWMGLEIDDSILSEDDLRILIKAAPRLLPLKGSRWAMEELIKLFSPQPFYLAERNLLTADQVHSEDLYGNTPHDFTVMLRCNTDLRLRMRLQFLIDQFKPIRSRCNIVFLDDCGGLDSFTYLDINGTVLQSAPGNLDDGYALTGMTFLS